MSNRSTIRPISCALVLSSDGYVMLEQALADTRNNAALSWLRERRQRLYSTDRHGVTEYVNSCQCDVLELYVLDRLEIFKELEDRSEFSLFPVPSDFDTYCEVRMKWTHFKLDSFERDYTLGFSTYHFSRNT